MRLKVYIAGKITGSTDDYKARFRSVEEALREAGYEPVSPAEAPDGLSYREYIKSGLDLLFQCDLICMIADPANSWITSNGARMEKEVAETIGMKFIYARPADPYTVPPFGEHRRYLITENRYMTAEEAQSCADQLAAATGRMIKA